MQPFFSFNASAPASFLGLLKASASASGAGARLDGIGLSSGRADQPALQMWVGHDIRGLLDLRQEGDGALREPEVNESPAGRRDRRAEPSSSSAPQAPVLTAEQRKPLIARSPAQLVDEHMQLWRAAAMARLSNREAAVRAYGNSILRVLREGGIDDKVVDRVGFAFTAMRDAARTLDARAAEARARLAQADTLASLAARGLDPATVDAQIDRAVGKAMPALQGQALQGLATFTLVAPASELFEMAVRQAERQRDAEIARLAPAASPASATLARPPPSRAQTPATATRAPLAGSLDHPPITNRQQALDALQRFEADRKTRLPQYGSMRQLGVLSTGTVRFRNAHDMASTFPCAVRILTSVRSSFMSPYASAPLIKSTRALYPGGEDDSQLAAVRSGEVNGRVAYTAWAQDHQHMRFSPDRGANWIETDIYTDQVVEDAKLRMWDRIFREAFPLSFHEWSYAHIT